MKLMPVLMAAILLFVGLAHATTLNTTGEIRVIADPSRTERLASVFLAAFDPEQIGTLTDEFHSMSTTEQKFTMKMAGPILGGTYSLSVPAARFVKEDFTFVKDANTFQVLDLHEATKSVPDETPDAKFKRIFVSEQDVRAALRLARTYGTLNNIEEKLKAFTEQSNARTLPSEPFFYVPVPSFGQPFGHIELFGQRILPSEPFFYVPVPLTPGE